METKPSEQILSLLEVAGIGKKEAARRIGISRPTLDRVLAGLSCKAEVAEKIHAWSSGLISKERIVFPE